MSQNGAVAELTTKQQALLSEMLTGKTVEQAATAAKVKSRTAYRWAKLPEFKAALADAQQELFESHLSMLKTGVRAALLALARNMGEKIPPGVQVAAARVWLDNAIQVFKVDQLEKEAEHLKQLLAQADEWQR